ncbi:toxic anion resistance protein [Sphingomonas sp. NFR15]|uniref:toxic anion resistance protein n=1 Tax=Sphingomonas sp. NFR15 TaxID=1566282 RepID=UPI0008830803|nr:toxic anion resistance protein [Sphingomonas sp. NFR15]SDA14157.1 Toxic anion resistance protein (TelA) [Sphingomonas sp. NFR15]
MSVPERDRDVRAEARLILRQWLASAEDAVLSAIDALGRQAIAAAAEASGRLERGVGTTAAAEQGLQTLQTLAQSIAEPPPKPAWSLFPGRAVAETPTPPAARIEALVDPLARERDSLTRARIMIDTDRARLRAAAEALDGAIELIRACAKAVESAAREIARDRPDRAHFLRGPAAGRLLAREQDVLTQAAVTQQGILTLDLLANSQDALAQALDRARETSIAALRTALAARRAVAGSEALSRQAAALERTADAARDAPTAGDALHRALDDAIAQARRAIDAAEASRGAL